MGKVATVFITYSDRLKRYGVYVKECYPPIFLRENRIPGRIVFFQNVTNPESVEERINSVWRLYSHSYGGYVFDNEGDAIYLTVNAIGIHDTTAKNPKALQDTILPLDVYNDKSMRTASGIRNPEAQRKKLDEMEHKDSFTINGKTYVCARHPQKKRKARRRAK